LKEKDTRRLSFIIVPHGDLETRTYDISYRRLKGLLIAGFVLLVMFVVMASTWWFVAAQAARVVGLEAEVERLEAERARVVALARDLSEAEQQYARVRHLLGVDGGNAGTEVVLPPLRSGDAESPAADARANWPTAWPLAAAGFITQRRVAGTEGEHSGLDIAVSSDSYIRAAGAGVVTDAGTDEVYGNFILIDHGDGMESMYGHASRLFVRAGDRVERNEVIALSGSTGQSTAPHLHFEIRREGEPVDPLTFVTQPS
jgi:murein DD-endopeptidase MepM/ murein hydrolase activator NlpD